MSKSRSVLSAYECKELMHKSIKPIISHHKKSNINISINGVLNGVYWMSTLVAIVMLVVIFGKVMEAHNAEPAMAIVQRNERSEYSPSRGGVRIPELGKYDATEKAIIRSIGNKNIKVNGKSLVRYDLPDTYSNNTNFTFLNMLKHHNVNPDMKLSGLHIGNTGKVYIDENGFARHKPDGDQFTIGNQSDYAIITKIISSNNIDGDRYLIIADAGLYTIITDEKVDDVSAKYIAKFSGLPGDDTSEKVYNFLKNRGCSHEAVIGILANMHQESGVNPDKHQVGGPAKGILQWEGGRFNRLVEFANQNGREWTDLECQLEFLWVELNSKDINLRMKGIGEFSSNLMRHGISGHPQGFEGFKNTDDAEYATALFEGSFERAGIPMMHNRYNAIPGLNDKFKNIQAKNPSGLLKLITTQQSSDMTNSILKPELRSYESTKVLQSRILCIYKID